jgi:hypothetical protein
LPTRRRELGEREVTVEGCNWGDGRSGRTRGVRRVLGFVLVLRRTVSRARTRWRGRIHSSRDEGTLLLKEGLNWNRVRTSNQI